MSAAQPSPALHVVSSDQDTATRRLHRMMGQREALRPAFRTAWDELSHHFDATECEAWAEAVLTLAHINAGPACLMAYWDISKSEAGRKEIVPLLGAAQTAAEICRHAGTQAAVSALRALPVAIRVFGRSPVLARWWRVMDLMARQAPELIGPACERMREILAPGTIAGFENFVTAGLRAGSSDTTRRLAFFSLRDDLAQRMIARDLGGITFADTEIELKAFITALWGTPALLRSLPADHSQQPQRRASIAGPLIRLPEVYRGVQGDAARALFRAAAAHAQAHLVRVTGRFPVGTLKPLQIALVNLIEDARIETLAMRQLRGLRRLWAPYHVASPDGVATAPVLLARLARALFDPDYVDDDAFVAKGRAMFSAAMPRIDQPAISREIGMLLGNDLGQMRVQFNARTYVVEPLYRDDGLGLWDFGETTPPAGEVVELPIDAVRRKRQETPGAEAAKRRAGADRAAGRPCPAGRARPARDRHRALSRMGPRARHRTPGLDRRARSSSKSRGSAHHRATRSPAPMCCGAGLDGWCGVSGSDAGFVSADRMTGMISTLTRCSTPGLRCAPARILIRACSGPRGQDSATCRHCC